MTEVDEVERKREELAEAFGIETYPTAGTSWSQLLQHAEHLAELAREHDRNARNIQQPIQAAADALKGIYPNEFADNFYFYQQAKGVIDAYLAALAAREEPQAKGFRSPREGGTIEDRPPRKHTEQKQDDHGTVMEASEQLVKAADKLDQATRMPQTAREMIDRIK